MKGKNTEPGSRNFSVKKNICDHKKVYSSCNERVLKNTGGILSQEIFDLGEFRIAKTAGDYITAGADFSLFKIKD